MSLVTHMSQDDIPHPIPWPVATWWVLLIGENLHQLVVRKGIAISQLRLGEKEMMTKTSEMI